MYIFPGFACYLIHCFFNISDKLSILPSTAADISGSLIHNCSCVNNGYCLTISTFIINHSLSARRRINKNPLECNELHGIFHPLNALIEEDFQENILRLFFKQTHEQTANK